MFFLYMWEWNCVFTGTVNIVNDKSAVKVKFLQ